MATTLLPSSTSSHKEMHFSDLLCIAHEGEGKVFILNANGHRLIEFTIWLWFRSWLKVRGVLLLFILFQRTFDEFIVINSIKREFHKKSFSSKSHRKSFKKQFFIFIFVSQFRQQFQRKASSECFHYFAFTVKTNVVWSLPSLCQRLISSTSS